MVIRSLIAKLVAHLQSLALRPADQGTTFALTVVTLASLSLAQFTTKPGANQPTTPPQFVIDPNSASEAELLLLPQVGPSLAKAIELERQKQPFKNPQDVGRTHGIGDKTLQKLLPHLRIP